MSKNERMFGRRRLQFPRNDHGRLCTTFLVLLAVSVATAFQSTRLSRQGIRLQPLGASLQTDSTNTQQATEETSEKSPPFFIRDLTHDHHHHQEADTHHKHVLLSSSSHHAKPLIKDLGLLSSHHDDHHHKHHTTHINIQSSLITQDAPTTTATTQQQESSYVLTTSQMKPLFTFTKNSKQKILNATGLYHLFILVLTMPIWIVSMEILQRLGDTLEGFDDNREKFDYAGKIWCRVYLSLVDCYPEIYGDVNRLKMKDSSTYQQKTVDGVEDENVDESGSNGACLFVANHASFLDIAVLCCVLDPVFKFIAKDSLAKFPGVGKQLVGVSFSLLLGFVCLLWILHLAVLSYSYTHFSLLTNTLNPYHHRESMSLSIVRTNVHNYVRLNKQSHTLRMVYQSW